MISAKYRRRTSRKVDPKFEGPRRVKVGFPAGEAGSEILERAGYNHFGTVHIPARPFITNAVRDNHGKYRRYLKGEGKKILLGESTPKLMLEKLGLLGQGDIQEEITNLSSPANAPSTIRRKGSSNPLIETGQMRGSVTYKVEGGGL